MGGQSSTLLKMSYGSEHVAVSRPITYKDAIKAAHQHFPELDPERISFQTNKLKMSAEDENWVRISEGAWDTAMAQLASVTIVQLPGPDDSKLLKNSNAGGGKKQKPGPPPYQAKS